MSQVIKSSLQEINEVILAVGSYTMTVTAGTAEQVDTRNHNFGKAVYSSYQLSLDGSTYFAMPNGQFGTDNFKNLQVYTDNDKIYFHYFYATSSPPAVTYYIRYKLFLTEAAK